MKRGLSGVGGRVGREYCEGEGWSEREKGRKGEAKKRAIG